MEENSNIVPLLPLRDIIVFPYMVVPLFVGRDKSVRALEEAMNNKKDIFLVAQKKAKTNDPQPEDIYNVGALSAIIQLLRLPDGTVKVLIEGRRRARLVKYVSSGACLMVEVEPFRDEIFANVECEALIRSIKSSFETYVKLNKRIPPEMLVSLAAIDNAAKLGDTVIAHLSLKLEDKQLILEMENVPKRLQKLLSLMEGEIEILQIEKKIRNRIKKQIEKSQKEYYLNEQMQAIQKELGERDEFKTEIREIEKALKEKNMSQEAAEKVRKELKKLKMMSPLSAEATVVRNYIDWIISLPWYHYSKDKIELKEAENILEEDHYGLKNVKERVLEYLAVQSLVDKIKGPILCLVGPPGVGKTSLARSIARATGRSFVRTSLGGVRDEAEVRGHRRTYIGALPGKIIQSLKKAATGNPVFLLDEVDKMSVDFRGDPSSALLEVLDPEQNVAFNDHYLELDYDLSRVMFITTANSVYNIPRPLLDRMEVLIMAGYTDSEKLEIAKQFLIPKQKKLHGLEGREISLTNNCVMTIIHYYTREAGVRNLERSIATFFRKSARRIVEKGDQKITATSKNIHRYLGVPQYHYTRKEEKNEIGVANGLAWTEVGGDLLVIETTILPGKGKLIVTGKLGEVMKESAQAALSYVRSRAQSLGLARDFYRQTDIHIHVPEGAIPKDGPSAGITMAASIVSALTKTATKKDLAMTGEITLRGRVLPIGGLKEKLLAAHRAGIKEIIIPQENEKDLKEIQKKILKSFRKIMIVHNMDQVLKEVLISKKTTQPSASSSATISPLS